MDSEEIKTRFTYHSPREDQSQRYVRIRGVGQEFAILLCYLCPESRELSLALTKLDEVVMWANAAIARRE